MSPTLYHKKEDCCGCKACSNACPNDAISFLPDEYGFQYPVINSEKCIGCEKCVKTCDFQKNEANGHIPIEGLAARHKDKAIYENSTSGGVFTAIAEWILAKGGLVYGCAYDSDMKPVHKVAENLDELASMRGSKYVQSDTGYVYRDVKEKIKEGRYVLFTGTPCQVAGLYSFLGKTNTEKLLTADIVCHGVPSQEEFAKYIHFLEKKYRQKIIDFKFRDKRYEWERPVISVAFKDGGSKWWFSTTDVYYTNFIEGNLLRLSCFCCKYSCPSRCGDITIGDFWGYQKAMLKMSVKEGVSCCLLNTEKAIKIFASLKVNYEKVAPEIIVKGNKHLMTCPNKGKNWENAMNILMCNDFDVLSSEFRKSHRMAFLKAKIKKIILKPRHCSSLV